MCQREIVAPRLTENIRCDVLDFREPAAVTWHPQAAAAAVGDLLVRVGPKRGNTTWQSWCGVPSPCSHKEVLLLSNPLHLVPPDSLAAPTALYGVAYVASLEAGNQGVFGLVSVCGFQIVQTCVSAGPEVSFAALTSHLCVAINWNDLQAPVVLQYELSISEKKTKKKRQPFQWFPPTFRCHTVFSSFFFSFCHIGVFLFFLD